MKISLKLNKINTKKKSLLKKIKCDLDKFN